MESVPVDYMPVSKVPSGIAKKDQKGLLYLDEEEFKKVKKESVCAGCPSITNIFLCTRLSNIISIIGKHYPQKSDYFFLEIIIFGNKFSQGENWRGAAHVANPFFFGHIIRM